MHGNAKVMVWPSWAWWGCQGYMNLYLTMNPWPRWRGSQTGSPLVCWGRGRGTSRWGGRLALWGCREHKVLLPQWALWPSWKRVQPSVCGGGGWDIWTSWSLGLAGCQMRYTRRLEDWSHSATLPRQQRCGCCYQWGGWSTLKRGLVSNQQPHAAQAQEIRASKSVLVGVTEVNPTYTTWPIRQVLQEHY